jgi:uncharacterized protein YbjT (DUF2867 family)
MPRVMTQQTALRFALAAASTLQNIPSNSELTADDWSNLADDLRAVAEYADAKADALTPRYEIRVTFGANDDSGDVMSLPLDSEDPAPEDYTFTGYGIYRRIGPQGELQWVSDHAVLSEAHHALRKLEVGD